MEQGEHIGGPLILFILFALFTAIPQEPWSLLVVLALAGLVVSTVRGRMPLDRFLIPVCLLVMTYPLTQHADYLIRYVDFVNEGPFLVTVSLFLLLALVTLVDVYRKPVATQ